MRMASVIALAAILSSLALAADVNSDFGLEESFVPQQPTVVGSPKALTWVDRDTISPGASRLTAAAVNGKVYRIGGEATGGARLGWTQEYDPIANTWTDRTPMLYPGSNLCCAVWNNKIYVPCSYGASLDANLQIFDPGANSWSTGTAVPTPVWGAAAAVVGDTLYVIGGYNASSVLQTIVQAYDLNANTWSTRASMANARAFSGAAVVDGKIYCIGGYTGTDQAYNEMYDPATNTWTTRAAMPTARGGLGVTTFGGKVYAVGGGWTSYLNTIDVYDPAADTWATETPMLHGCRTIGVASMGNDIFVVGGWNGTYRNWNQLGGQAPQVIWTSPADGATGAHVGSPAIKVAFSEPMYSWGYSWDPNPGAVNGTWNATQDTLTITHNQLAYSTTNQVGIGGRDLAGLYMAAGPVPNPFTFTTWDAPEVIHSQMDTPGATYASQVFGDFPTYSCYLADDINLAGMDSAVVTAIELVGGTWNGHSFHPFDSLYLSLTTDSSDYPAWSQEIWGGNLLPGQFDAIYDGTNFTYILYLDQPIQLNNGKSWMAFAPYMNFASKDGQVGWAENNPAVVYGSAPAWTNPGGAFGYGSGWNRASVLGMSGDGVFRLLGRNYLPSVSADSMYFKAFGGAALMVGDKTANPTPVNRTSMSFQYSQSVPCMDPGGHYVYEVYGSNLRRFRVDDGSYVDMALTQGGDRACGTDGQYIYVPNGSLVHTYTMAGGYIGTTTLDISVDPFAFAVVNDTVWASPNRYNHVFYAYPTTAFTGGSITSATSWDVGTGTNGTGNIAFDGTYYYIPWIGTSNITYKIFSLNRDLLSTGAVMGIDVRSVMCRRNPYTGVTGGPGEQAASRLMLGANFPNPVRGRTNISFNLPKAGAYELRVFNIAGQMVDRIAGTGQAGPNRLTWNAGRLAAGVYLYSVSSNGQSATRKLVVIR